MAEPWVNHHKDHASTHSEGGSAGDGNPSPTEKVKNLLARIKRATDGVVVWTPEEQRILEEGIERFVSLPSVVKYVKIAYQLPNKTLYDVAFRCRWMALKETGKRRREEGDSLTEELEDKKKKVSDSTPLKHVADMEDSAGVSDEGRPIAGEEGELLLSTSPSLRQISENHASPKVHENLEMFVKASDNVLEMKNNLSAKDGIMKEKVYALKDLPLETTIVDEAAEILQRTTVSSHQSSENLESSQINETLKTCANAGDNIVDMKNSSTNEDRVEQESLPINVETAEELLNSMIPPPKKPYLHAFF